MEGGRPIVRFFSRPAPEKKKPIWGKQKMLGFFFFLQAPGPAEEVPEPGQIQ